VKILLDTDIGSDIDDAVCLAYLLAQPECELLGITTVTGEAERRAMIASAVCTAAERDVPIFPGAEQPLLGEQRQPEAPQAAALSGLDHRTTFDKGAAVEFMRQTIRAHPGEVTLLGIGPLTNIALLFAIDREIHTLLEGLVLMCGVFTPEGRRVAHREWNAMLDSVAASIVYRAAAPVHRSIGLDVSMKAVLPADDVRRRFAIPKLDAVLQLAEVWFRDSDKLTFHDPLAAATIFDNDICGFERGQVSVRIGHERNVTDWLPDANGPHEVARSVDVDRFFRHFFGVARG
jgi:purine nucleosidase